MLDVYLSLFFFQMRPLSALVEPRVDQRGHLPAGITPLLPLLLSLLALDESAEVASLLVVVVMVTVPVRHQVISVDVRVLPRVVQEQQRRQRHAVALQALRAGELGEESPEVRKLWAWMSASVSTGEHSRTCCVFQEEMMLLGSELGMVIREV